MNTRERMYQTNSKIRHFLLNNNYSDIFLVPHLRFSKDFAIEGCKFDGLAVKENKLIFLQLKTNTKPSKKEITKFRYVALKYNILCEYIVYIKKKGVFVYR